MKIKQQRRWKRRTAAEQHQSACRVTGWVLWMLLLDGGAGFVAASAAGKYRMPSGSSSSAFAPLQKRADQSAAETLPGHGLFLQAYTAGTLATGGNRVQDVCLTQERLLEMPETLDTAELSKTATLFNDFYQAYEVPMFLGAVPAAGEFYAADLLGSAPFSSQLSELDTFYDEVSSPIRKIDIYQILSTAKDDYIYHRTDAQWTGYGAYCVYRSAIRKMGFIPVSYDQYAVSHVGTYRGSLYRACYDGRVTPDILDRYTCSSGSSVTSVTAYAADGTEEERQMYDHPSEEDPSAYVLGEPCEKIVVQTDVDNQRKLLLLGDADAAYLVPFLMQHYREICFLNVDCASHGAEELADLSGYHQILVLCDADAYGDAALWEKLLHISSSSEKGAQND